MSGLFAQNHLKLGGIFEKYGKTQGTTLVQLGKDVLSQGSKMTLYKSLEVKSSDAVNKEILEALEADIRNKAIISESRKSGKIESGTYYIGKNGNNEDEYILFKMRKDKISLVYLRGNFSPQNLEYELNKLKDLFIYVNNKRIKL